MSLMFWLAQSFNQDLSSWDFEMLKNRYNVIGIDPDEDGYMFKNTTYIDPDEDGYMFKNTTY
jgi:hypothetical protein